MLEAVLEVGRDAHGQSWLAAYKFAGGALLGTSAPMPRHGRRLFEAKKPTTRSLSRPIAQQPPKAGKGADAALTANETVALIRERELLQGRLKEIDAVLAADRDAKRRALTAEYEREMQKLDEDEFAAGETLPAKGGGLGGGEGVNGLREQVAAAVAAQTHQDVEHQDIDIDVMMMHIDKDGDGVITPSEAYGVYPLAA